MSDTLVHDPMSVAALLATLVAAIFWLSGLKRLEKFFEYVPPVIFCYFVPMLLTSVGVTPSSSVAYDWIRTYFLPLALFLLMVSVDLKGVLKLGPKALIMIVAGTAGIVIGAPVALLVFQGALGPDAWKGFAALSGSWIGGTANMVAVAESVGTPESEMGPIIVVDTVVGYGWMGILLAISGLQSRWDQAINADTSAIEAVNARLEELSTKRHPSQVRDMAMLVGLGVGAAVLAVRVGDGLPSLGDPTIISGTTWAVLIVVTVGLVLSFTPMRKLEEVGASSLGYAALYLLLAAIGARADLRAVLDAPLYLVAGALWLSIHVALLFAVAYLIRAPLFFVATGSMANVGGAASAPVVAGVYHPALAPVGLLMAVAGYVLGMYAAFGAAWILGQIGG
jgi:uncharacterized membrane protein